MTRSEWHVLQTHSAIAHEEIQRRHHWLRLGRHARTSPPSTPPRSPRSRPSARPARWMPPSSAPNTAATSPLYNDLDAMLANPDIHVVSICSYPNQHVAQVVKAARAGQTSHHREAAGLSLKDLRAMQAAITKAKVKTCVCFECRYSSQFLATKATIDAGPARHAALRRGGLLSRHRAVVRPVPLEHPQGSWAAVRCSPPAATRSTPCCSAWAARSPKSRATTRNPGANSSRPTNTRRAA